MITYFVVSMGCGVKRREGEGRDKEGDEEGEGGGERGGGRRGGRKKRRKKRRKERREEKQIQCGARALTYLIFSSNCYQQIVRFCKLRRPVNY